MSLLGKVLVILNIFGAAGLLWLATWDLSKRKAWSRAVTRNEIMLEGLPLDEEDHKLGGERLVHNLDDEMLQEVCSGGPAVTTQEAEVQRVQQDLQARLKQQAGTSKRAEVYLLAQVLLPQARDNAQREEYLSCRHYLATDASLAVLQKDFKEAYTAAAARAQKEPDSFDETFHQQLRDRWIEPARPFITMFLQMHKAAAQAPFDKLFADTLEQLRATYQAQLDNAFRAAQGERVVEKGTVKSDRGERRKEIARLLFLLVDVLPDANAKKDAKAGQGDLVNSSGYRRYINIVGLRRAVGQLKAQAQILQDIAAELNSPSRQAALDHEMVRDRSRFIQEHRGLIDEIRVRADEVRVLATQLARKQVQLKAQQDIVKARQKNVDDYRADLQAARDETTKEMQALQKMSQALFDKRVEVRKALEDNYKDEQTIRALEADR